jgi:hypothetical protein
VALVAAVVSVAVLLLLGDEPTEEATEPLGSVGAVPEVPTASSEPTLPTEVDSPWCLALLALDQPDGPTGADLAASYRSIAATAPPGLGADLIGAADRILAGDETTVVDAVIDAVDEGGDDPVATATLPEEFDAEGRPVEDDPLLRVAEYVESMCRATGSNPGPQATAPAVAADPTTTGP